MTGVAVLLTVLAGLAGSVQVAVMGRFGGRIGVIEALTFSTAVQLLLSATILVVARMGLGGLGGAFRTPAWMWLGGLMGLIVVGDDHVRAAAHRRDGDDRDPDRGPARDGRA